MNALLGIHITAGRDQDRYVKESRKTAVFLCRQKAILFSFWHKFSPEPIQTLNKLSFEL